MVELRRCEGNVELSWTLPGLGLAQLNHAKNISSPDLSSAGFDFLTFHRPDHQQLRGEGHIQSRYPSPDHKGCHHTEIVDLSV